MSIRASEIYVSRGTRRILFAVARSERGTTTADEVAERLLSEVLEKKYPALVVLQKQIEALERQMSEAVNQ